MKKTANRLTDMEFDEVSLVTRPANQLSKVVLFKSDTNADSEDEMPEVEIEETTEEVVEETTTEEEVVEKGKKMKPKMNTEDEMSEEDMAEDEAEMPMKKGKMKKDDEVEIPSEVLEYIEALENANSELLSAIEKMEADIAEEEAKVEEEILKSADPRLVEIVKAAEERATAAEAIAKAERDYRLEREFVAKAHELNHLPVTAEEFGIVLKNAADGLSESDFDALWQVLTAANSNIEKSGIFSEVGKSVDDNTTGSPMALVEKAAVLLMKDNPNLSKEQAIAKAVEADANLYNQYIREGR